MRKAMWRISARQVLQAYFEIGCTAIQRQWEGFSRRGHSVCPALAIALANDVWPQDPHNDYFQTLCIVLKYDPDYLHGFIYGIDVPTKNPQVQMLGPLQIATVWFTTRRLQNFACFSKGQRDGRRVRRTLIKHGLFWQSFVPQDQKYLYPAIVE